MKNNDFETLVKESINNTFSKSGHIPKPQKKLSRPKTKKPLLEKVITKTKQNVAILKEVALVTLPKGFLLKTEHLSARTKEAHEVIYKAYIDAFNKSSSQLSGVNKEEANSYHSSYRSVSKDETRNLNAVKLHELYFGNISDLNSEVSMDSVPYIKFARNFGTFDQWQFDFIAACMASQEGFALTVWEPYQKVYMNVIIDGDDNGIPLGTIPVLAMDMHSHAYYKDYANDKKSYIVAMMRELNWSVVEARMVVAERSQLHDLWKIMPLVNSQPEAMLSAAELAQPKPVEPVPAHAAQNPNNVRTQ